MKNLIAILAFLIAAVFTACQENPLMDNPPNDNQGSISNDVQQNISIPKTSSKDNILKLDALLLDPRQGIGHQLCYALIGTVEYDLTYRQDHPVHAQEFQNTSLRLKINAKLLPQTGRDNLPYYSIIAESIDRFNIPMNGSRTILLKKTYRINGFPKVYLKCVYEVSTSSVSIKELKLFSNIIAHHSIVNQN